jgi:hypothetical protein
VRHQGGGRSPGADLHLWREVLLLMALVPRNSSIAHRVGRLPRPVAQHIEAVRIGGLVTSAQVMAAAHVTKVALNLASALTAEEALLVRTNPLGEERYRLLVDSFTAVAAFRGWGCDHPGGGPGSADDNTDRRAAWRLVGLALRPRHPPRPGGRPTAGTGRPAGQRGLAPCSHGRRERNAQDRCPAGRWPMRGGLRRLVLPATQVGDVDPEDTGAKLTRISAEIRLREQLLDDLLDAELLAARRRGYLE